MVVRYGRVTDTSQPDLTTLLRDILQQQTAMLQVQAESVRLQQVLVEHLVGVSGPQSDALAPGSIAATSSTSSVAAGLTIASATPAPSVPIPPLATPEPAPIEATPERSAEPTSVEPESDLPFAPAPVEQNPARGARYYQPRPSPAARSIAPEELELMRRLQEMRESSDLILQFGPYEGSTLAQVAMSNPNTFGNSCGVPSAPTPARPPDAWCKPSMQRPNTCQKRAAPHAVGAPPDSAVAQMTRRSRNCERCAAFSREPREVEQRVSLNGVADLAKPVRACSRRSKAWVAAAFHLARYATALLCFVHVVRRGSNRGDSPDLPGVEHA